MRDSSLHEKAGIRCRSHDERQALGVRHDQEPGFDRRRSAHWHRGRGDPAMTRGDIMIRRLALAVLTLPLAIGASCVLAQETYTVDPVHSQPGYEIRHLAGL